jgi:superfamily II DNA/RNA helicase
MAYLHRSGRTARAGAGGTVVTVVTPDQTAEVRTLARQAGISPVVTPVGPAAPLLDELAGPPAPYVQPAPAPEPQRPAGGRRRRGGSPSTGSAPKTQGRASGPARTRAELAARAGTTSAASFSARSRRGR